MTKRAVLVTTTVLLLAAIVVLWPRTISDYGAGASGLVVDGQGKPLPEALVTITFDRPAIEAVTPVKSAEVRTDTDGRFELTFISCGRPGGGYTLHVARSGFAPVTLRGEGMGRRRIVLREIR